MSRENTVFGKLDAIIQKLNSMEDRLYRLETGQTGGKGGIDDKTTTSIVRTEVLAGLEPMRKGITDMISAIEGLNLDDIEKLIKQIQTSIPHLEPLLVEIRTTNRRIKALAFKMGLPLNDGE